MLKKYTYTILIAFLLLFSAACGKENKNNNSDENPQGVPVEPGTGEENDLPNGENDSPEDLWSDADWENLSTTKGDALLKAVLYYETHPVDLLCSGENGTVYAYDRAGEKLCEYSTEGKCVKEYPFHGDGIYSICYHDGKIYYIESKYLSVMDLLSGESEVFYTFDGDSYMFGRMVWMQDGLFILRKGQYREEWEDVGIDAEDEYTYEGEVLLYYNLSTNKMQTLDIPNIKQIAKKNEKELFIYAYDAQGGFYFASCDVDGKTGKKQYTKIKRAGLLDIAYDETTERLICTDLEGVFLAELKSISDKTYMFQGVYQGMNTLLCEDGFTYELFYIDGQRQLVRMENSLFVDKAPALKAYTLDHMTPPRYGYKINYEEKTYDELAMILLAGDSDYDFIIMNSWDVYSGGIPRVGAYSALDSVSSISELMKECHPYIKEAATAPNGDLWMLPLTVECPVIIYNEEKMEEYGLRPEQIDTYTELVEQTVKLPKDGSVLYSVMYYLMTVDITNKYLADYAIKGNKSDFHTDVFHTYLDIMSQYDRRVNAEEIIFDTMRYADTTNQDEYYAGILFAMLQSEQLQELDYYHYAEYDFFHALPAPNLEEGKKQKAQAKLTFLVVNPNSKKKKWVMEYLGEVCKGLRADKNSMMLQANDFSDRPLWQEVQEIIADAEIYFAYPDEIISDELYHYRMEGQSYEDTVKELERKMDMYLNE